MAESVVAVPGTPSPVAVPEPQIVAVPIAKVAVIPLVLVAANAQPMNNITELVAYAKANPGKLSYASSGPGTNSGTPGASPKNESSMSEYVMPGARWPRRRRADAFR